MVTEDLLQEIEDGQGEKLLQTARRLPSNRLDRPVTLSCILRWILSGVIGPDGKRVYLEAARLAGKWITTPGAIRRFIDAQTPRLGEAPTRSARSASARRRASQVAEKKLQKLGI